MFETGALFLCIKSTSMAPDNDQGDRLPFNQGLSYKVARINSASGVVVFENLANGRRQEVSMQISVAQNFFSQTPQHSAA